MMSVGRHWMIAVAAFALATAALADAVLYDFENGAQGWTSAGPITTDSGALADGAVGQGRYHTGDFSLSGWGMVDVSPTVNLSAYTGLRVAARFHTVTGYPAFSGTPVLRIGLGIGDAEWLADVTLTGAYYIYSFNFTELIPDGVYATAPITTEQLADPNLQNKFVMPKGSNTGVGQFDYDQVTALGAGGTSQLLPGEVIYDFYPAENHCYPDDWTFFGISQTDFGADASAEDGYGAFQAADWGLCDMSYGEGTIGCTWAGCAA